MINCIHLAITNICNTVEGRFLKFYNRSILDEGIYTCKSHNESAEVEIQVDGMLVHVSI